MDHTFGIWLSVCYNLPVNPKTDADVTIFRHEIVIKPFDIIIYFF